MDIRVKAGSYSELRTSEKAKESQDEHGIERASGVDRMVTSAEDVNTFSQDF